MFDTGKVILYLKTGFRSLLLRVLKILRPQCGGQKDFSGSSSYVVMDVVDNA